MAGKIVYRRHYMRDGDKITVSSEEKLTHEGWKKLVTERHGEGWVQIAPHIAMDPFPRVSKKGMML